MFEPRSGRGESNLAKVIGESQSAPQALPGNGALVGFSLGGAGVLLGDPPDLLVWAGQEVPGVLAAGCQAGCDEEGWEFVGAAL